MKIIQQNVFDRGHLSTNPKNNERFWVKFHFKTMQGVPDFIIERQLKHFEKVHPDYAAGIKKALAKLP